MFGPIAFGMAAVLGLPSIATAATGDSSGDSQQLRKEIQQLKQDYDQRIKALEDKLQQQEEATQAVQAAPATAPPQQAAAGSGGNAFNPKISLILNGTYADYSSKAAPEIAGFIRGPETDFASSGLALGESEIALDSNIDEMFHGWATLSFEGGEANVEEAFINTLELPSGFSAKFGRFFSDIGYQNHQHAHAWEFADAPLVYRAMFANQLGDDGLQLKWIAPTDLLVEVGGELLRGDAFPAGGDERNGINTYTGFLHVGGDYGPSSSYRVGLSQIHAKSNDRRTGDDIETSFTGKSDITGLDFVYKWAPNGNPVYRNFVFQTEYFYRKEDGLVISDPDGAADTSGYNGHQDGFYVQGIYQFMPKWRFGVRYDQLNANNDVGNPVAGTSLETLADDGGTPKRWSAMVDWSNSEFSRLRLQYNRDESRPDGVTDNQLLLQYIFAMGSHPAHQF